MVPRAARSARPPRVTLADGPAGLQGPAVVPGKDGTAGTGSGSDTASGSGPGRSPAEGRGPPRWLNVAVLL